MPRKAKAPLSPAEPASVAQRVAKHAASKRAQGMVPRQIWSLPERWHAIKRIAELPADGWGAMLGMLERLTGGHNADAYDAEHGPRREDYEDLDA